MNEEQMCKVMREEVHKLTDTLDEGRLSAMYVILLDMSKRAESERLSEGLMSAFVTKKGQEEA